MPPFLSVVTRTHPKPVDYLALNEESLREQLDPDYEQIVLRDEVGRGLAWANRQFYEHRFAVEGDYVLMLDDDNVLATPHAVTILKAVTWDKPEAVIFKAEVGPHGILPTSFAWGQRRAIAWQIDGHCVIVRREVWQAYIHEFCVDVRGDAAFLGALTAAGLRIEWLNAVLVRALRVGSLAWEGAINAE
jgi:hypothetical protein